MFPVSVKGVVARDGRVLLLRNERDEWELPGGRLEVGETPQECLAREVREETGWRVRVGPILDSWVYHVERRQVVIITYGCHLDADPGEPVVSPEHLGVRLAAPAELPALPMPEGYRGSIAAWLAASSST